MPSESSFERKFIKRLRQLPHSYWPPKGTPGSTRGVPDRLGCVRGKFIGLEFKRGLAEALARTPRQRLQEFTLDDIQRAGGYGTYVYPENSEVVYQTIAGFK